jgi:hypothetical protein
VLVYGDHKERADVAERLVSIAGQLRAVAGDAPGIERHSRLVGALINAGQLLQGVADRGDAADELHLFLHRLAGAVVRSADSGFREVGELPAVPSVDLSGEVELSLPEGFAFYAVYPESYIAAARGLSLLGPIRVIGIRSIGTTLGAVVAAVLGAPVALTVRPFGDPFARLVELPADAIEPDAHYVIVDEGPGLSGSSFGAVADALEAHGVPPDRIAFLPSHCGDLGPHASEPHRRRWHRVRRVAAEFDPTFLTERFGPLELYSIGNPWERLKYLAGHGVERVLLKFAGLGSVGARKLEMARMLHSAGFTPEPLGLVHGFLVERWCADAEPLRVDEKPIAEMGAYIDARARLFPSVPSSGASIDELILMCRRNISLALGESAAERLPDWDARALSARVARVRSDNKLDRVEWLRLPGGRLLKTDALDHHQAHDLIGCQDIAWDVAGAITEFNLDANEVDQLIATSSCEVDRELLAFYRVAYCSFRLGQAALCGTGDQRYSRALDRLLHEHATRDSARILV